MKVVLTLPGVAESMLVIAESTTGEVLYKLPWDDEFIGDDNDDTMPEQASYGITWNESNVFVTNRRVLLVLDNELKLVEKYNVLDQNSHQAAMWRNYVVVALTRKDSVGLIDINDGSTMLYHPDYGWREDYPTLESNKTLRRNGINREARALLNAEQHHINSVTVVDDKMYFLIHRPSTVVVMDLNTKKEIERKQIRNISPASMLDPMAVQSVNLSHNIVVDGNNIYTITTNGWIASTPGSDFIPEGNLNTAKYFARGFSGTINDHTVGCSYRVDKRENRFRNTNHSWLKTPNGLVQLGFKGVLRDIRRIDGIDHGHHNKHLFPFKDVR